MNGLLAHGDVSQRNVRTGEIGEFPARRAGLCYNGVVGCDRKAATTKLRQVGGGEIPSSAEVGSAVHTKYYHYFTQYKDGTG